jgi:hypothetical protein
MGDGRTGLVSGRKAVQAPMCGHSGDFVVEATNTTTMQPECPLNDAPNWLAATVAGTYQASLWVRADTPGNPVELRIRAYSDGTFVSSAESLVIPDTAAPAQTSTLEMGAGFAGTVADCRQIVLTPPEGLEYGTGALGSVLARDIGDRCLRS